MDRSYPTRRPIDPEFREAGDGGDSDALPPELATLPWVDIHNHAQTLSWTDRERFALAGCHAMVMVAAGYYWTPYKPVAPEDVRYLWDDALNRVGAIGRSHAFDPKLAVGVHTGTPVADVDEALEAMPAYCELDEVAAVGETGITAGQHVEQWSLDDQRHVVGRQLEIAAEHDLPAILHTPSNPGDFDITAYERGQIPRYELDTSLGSDPVLDGETVKRDAVEIDVELANEAGLPEEQVVLSHANASVVPYVMEETDCNLSFTVSYPWLHDVSPADVAAAVSEYGPDRILLETDAAGVLDGDVFDLKRWLFALYRHGLDPETIRRVTYENPMALLS
ncbi:TatD family hydrolase [Halobium salinum]|uniref:TatD family hydrolase n=1 Tax=Halobium salinum TaxID=1364940 RepID=A0ABD5PFP5_9EURY|nr:TatD family hydrolase [Halobium salinum]